MFRRRPIRAGAEGRLGDSLRPRCGPLHSEARWRSLEIEAEFVHRGHQGSDRPTRVATLRGEAHGRRHNGGRQQSRPYALAPRLGDQCHPCRRKCSSKSHGSSVKRVDRITSCLPTIRELMTTTALLGPDPAPLTSLIAGQRRPHHPARVAGLRVKSTPLTTMPHTRPMAGETKRE